MSSVFLKELRKLSFWKRVEAIDNEASDASETTLRDANRPE
jgi:hypothetical protein